jgi:hypothetical protein
MSDDQKQDPINIRPLDSTRSGEDLIGDTTGMTGITTGKTSYTSSTPTDDKKDENKNHLPGGLMDNNDSDASDSTMPITSDKQEKHNAQIGLSDARMDRVNDIASEPDEKETTDLMLNDKATPDTDNEKLHDALSDTSLEDNTINTTSAPYAQPYNQGEQSVSGSTPDPDADDDTLANAQAMGTQLEEDEEHPQELNLAGDIDKAEEYHRTH